MSRQDAKGGRTAFHIVLLVFCAYAVLFIARTSFFIEGERYFSLFDDSMVCMRYAKNLASGHGLVWNPEGERVEGFVNLFWVLYMALFHLLPVAPSKIALFLQASGVLFLLLNLMVVRKIADMLFDGSAFLTTCAVLLTAFYYPLNYWSVLGMEVSFLTLLLSTCTWIALQCMQCKKPSLRLYLLLGLGILVRLDMAVPYLGFFFFLLLADPQNRKKNLAWGLTVFVTLVASLTLFRVLYYGEFVPNTYFVKMTGYPLLHRLTRGLYVFLDFLWRMNWAVFLFSLSILLFLRDKRTLLLVWAFFVQALYSIYVGGDAWEEYVGCNRLIVIVMPLIFLLFCGSLGKMKERFVHTGRGNRARIRCGAIAVVLLSLLSFNTNTSLKSLGEWLLVERPFYVLNNQEMVRRGLILKRITKEGAKIGVFWAGAAPYFFDRHAIDFLGKLDKKIARDPRKAPGRISGFFSYLPGHTKWNYSYSIGVLKPDIITELFAAPEEARPFMGDYVSVPMDEWFQPYLLRESPHILWNRIRSMQ